MPERKSLKPIPKFESEDEEREFWATHDSTEHVDWSRAKPTTFSRTTRQVDGGSARKGNL